MAKLFQRRCKVTLIKKSGVAKIYENVDGNGIRIAFSIRQSVDSKSNTGDVILYNLNESSRSVAEDCHTYKVEAGYNVEGKEIGLLFSGRCVTTGNKRGTVGWETTLSASDGYDEKQAIVNVALSPGASIADAVKAIANTLKVSVKRAVDRAKKGDFDGAIKTFEQGLVLSGPAEIELNKLTASVGADWSIQNGELQILLPGETNGIIVKLSPATGLVGSPEIQKKKIDIKGGEKSRIQPILVARSLLIPELQPGARVEMKSQAINGSFAVQSVLHAGDTDGADWYSDIEALPDISKGQEIGFDALRNVA